MSNSSNPEVSIENQQCDIRAIVVGEIERFDFSVLSGARVVPIRFEQSKSDLLQLLDQLNGALLTGGEGKPACNS